MLGSKGLKQPLQFCPVYLFLGRRRVQHWERSPRTAGASQNNDFLWKERKTSWVAKENVSVV